MPIAGATGASYVPTGADEGQQQLRVEVTATGEGGKTAASSALTAGVKAGALPPPGSTGAPAVSGEARETETLAGTVGNWTGSPTVFEYQWLRCASPTGGECAPVVGATSATYTLVRADVGDTMRLHVTAINQVGSTSAESSPTGIVQPLVIRARFSISPGATCTGLGVELDGSASQTPNAPITSYAFTYKNVPEGLFDIRYLETLGPMARELIPAVFESLLREQEPSYLADSANPRATVTFTWDETEGGTIPFSPGEYTRDNAIITLTVTDRAGATASVEHTLQFLQHGSKQSRSACPAHRIITPRSFTFLAPARFAISKTTIASSVHCATATPCAGTLTVLSTHVLAGRAQVSVGRKPSTIASAPLFTIAGHHTATIRAKLTRAGRTLLKHGRRVKAVVDLTSVSPLGRSTVHPFRVTLRGR